MPANPIEPSTAPALPATLWPAGRSALLSPLYAERYDGPLADGPPGSLGHCQLLTVRTGRAILHAASGKPAAPAAMELTAATVCLLPPGAAHRLTADRPVEMLRIGLGGSRPASLIAGPPRLVVNRDLVEVLDLLWRRSQLAHRPVGTELDALALAAFAQFERLAAGRPGSDPDGIDQAVEHLHRQLAEPVAMAELAARCGLSEGHFFRAFKRRTGLSPLAYQARLRLQRAESLMRHSGLPLKRIAALVGYSDPLYFSRIFRKLSGHTASEARRRQRR